MNSASDTLEPTGRPPTHEIPLSNVGSESNRRSHRIEQLIETIDTFPDSMARELMQECLQSLLRMYGDGLARILQLTRNTGIQGAAVMDALLRDKLVRSLLLVHDLHPESLETRIRKALDTIRPYLQSHGGDVELLNLENGVARLRLQGTCQTCPSSSVTLELAVRQAVEEACPDLHGFEVDGVESTASNRPINSNTPRWTILKDFEGVPTGAIRSLIVEDEPIVICKPNGNHYAYRNRCAVCGASFDSGTLADHLIRCPEGHSFDVQRAGRSLDNSGVHLVPVPLLVAEGAIKLAVNHENPVQPQTED